MIKPRVYVETSIPSFYHERRTAPDIVARRDWTRLWWTDAAQKYELVISPVVIGELSLGIPERSAERLALVKELPLLTVEDEIAEIVATYVQHKVMPADPSGDAFHLAIASFHKCDFLATWNCRHIANANKFDHIRRINTLLGLFIPALVTPLELLGAENESQNP